MVSMRFPNAFVHPYEMTDKNGRTWSKAIVGLLPGTTVNGVDLSGYRMDVFLRDFQLQDKAMGKAVTLRFKVTAPIELFKGSGEDRRELKVYPIDLARANKAAREAYASARGADGARGEDGGARAVQPEPRGPRAAAEPTTPSEGLPDAPERPLSLDELETMCGLAAGEAPGARPRAR